MTDFVTIRLDGAKHPSRRVVEIVVDDTTEKDTIVLALNALHAAVATLNDMVSKGQ